MKKIKQLADKAFVRVPASDVLTAELTEAEHRIELLRSACEVLVKRITGGSGHQVEKRIKKVPEFYLGQGLVEIGSRCGRESNLGDVLEESGRIEMKLASALVEHEDKIEKHILQPLSAILQTEIPAAQKSKRHLLRLMEAMEAARGRRRDEVEEAEFEELVGKVEQQRDSLTSAMYDLLTRESEVSEKVAQFLRLQREHHSNMAGILSNLYPEVDVLLAKESKVFGVDLAQHLEKSGRTIAYPIELCACGLLESLDEEGLFRVQGGAAKTRKLRSAIDAHLLTLPLLNAYDPNSIASTLKAYLRSLPTPLLSFPIHSWAEACREDNIQRLVESLPDGNRANLRYLVKFLQKLEARQECNKMTAGNIAIVIGPNLLWGAEGDELMAAGVAAGVLERLLKGAAEKMWPGDIDFHITCAVAESSPKPVTRRKNKAPTIPPPPSITRGRPTGMPPVRPETVPTQVTQVPEAVLCDITPEEDIGDRHAIKELLAEWCKQEQAKQVVEPGGDKVDEPGGGDKPEVVVEKSELAQIGTEKKSESGKIVPDKSEVLKSSERKPELVKTASEKIEPQISSSEKKHEPQQSSGNKAELQKAPFSKPGPGLQKSTSEKPEPQRIQEKQLRKIMSEELKHNSEQLEQVAPMPEIKIPTIPTRNAAEAPEPSEIVKMRKAMPEDVNSTNSNSLPRPVPAPRNSLYKPVVSQKPSFSRPPPRPPQPPNSTDL